MNIVDQMRIRCIVFMFAGIVKREKIIPRWLVVANSTANT
jgi:hypothetical protein